MTTTPVAAYSFDNQNLPVGITYRLAITDRLGLHDAAAVEGRLTQQVIITDRLGLTGRLSTGGDFAGQTYQVTLTDSLGLSDGNSGGLQTDIGQAFTDRLGFTDHITTQLQLAPQTHQVTLTDRLGLHDNASVVHQFPVTTTEIYGDELDVGRMGAQGVTITARLVASVDQVWDESNANIIKYATTTTDSNGHWSLPLTPTDSFSAQTYYDLSVGLHRIYPIDVPESASPVNVLNCLIDRPAWDDSGVGGESITVSDTEPRGPHHLNQLWLDTSTEE